LGPPDARATVLTIVTHWVGGDADDGMPSVLHPHAMLETVTTHQVA